MATNKKSHLPAIFIGILLVIFLSILAEFSFRLAPIKHFLKKNDSRKYITKPLPEKIAKKYKINWANNLNIVKPEKNDKLNTSKKYEKNKVIKYKSSILNHYKPFSTVHSIMQLTPSNKVVYDVYYQIDNVGRRKVINRKRNAKKSLLMLGGSNTWGDGVGDDQIFPYLTQKSLANHEVYIAAKPGFGAGDILYSLQNNSFMFKDIKQSSGTAIFFFIDDHPNRSLPSTLSLKHKYLLSKPYYQKKFNKLILQGFFEDNFSYKFFKLVARSEILRYLGLKLPMSHANKSSDLFINTLLEIENLLKVKYNIEKLILVSLQIGPTSGLGYIVKDKWQKLGRNFYDISEYDFKKITNNQHKYPLDRHKTAPVHWLRTQFLMPILSDHNIN